MSILYAGIDVSQANFTCSLWISENAVDLGEFTNNQAGFAALAAAIAPHQATNEYETLHIILEATGGYELRLLSFINAQGWLFSLPNPLQVREWAKGMGYRVKTDRIDGRKLAHFGSHQPPPKVVA